ncbi:hypothetical protein MYX06_03415 [Patescibacteria group bacterium AH-259-L05]|nr:hypothetical protein [Patescibacteria group bacterium AH-259-L05]
MNKLLLKEKLVRLSDIKANPTEKLKGFVRIVSEKGKLSTKGFFFDKQAFEDLLESLEYSSTKFWGEISRSRKSGTVSAKKIEKRLGI